MPAGALAGGAAVAGSSWGKDEISPIESVEELESVEDAEELESELEDLPDDEEVELPADPGVAEEEEESEW